MGKKTLVRCVIVSRAMLLSSIFAVLWIACGGGGGGGGDGSTPVPSSKVLNWDSPTQFADGGTLDASNDLSFYEIYINETGVFLDNDAPKAAFPAVNISSGAPVTTYDLATITPSLETGRTYYLAMRATEKNGGRSGYTLPPLAFVY